MKGINSICAKKTQDITYSDKRRSDLGSHDLELHLAWVGIRGVQAHEKVVLLRLEVALWASMTDHLLKRERLVNSSRLVDALRLGPS